MFYINKMSNKVPSDTFPLYVSRVLRQVHPDMKIGRITREQVSSFMDVVARELVSKAHEMNRMAGRKTITSREIQIALRLVLPGELAKHAVSEGTKAVIKFGSTDAGTKGAPIRHETRAGLTVSTSLARRYIKEFSSSSMHIGAGAPIYLAGALEYLIAEIMELGGNACRDQKRVTISIRDVMLAINNDAELSELRAKNNIYFLGAGVLPFIDGRLIPSEEKKKQNANQRRRNNKDKEGKSSHHFLPGTQALNEIRRLQKSGDLLLPMLPIRRFFLEVLQDYADIRFPDRSVLLLQAFIESVMVDLFAKSQKAALHAGRESVMPDDLNLAWAQYQNLAMVGSSTGTSKSQARLAKGGAIKHTKGGAIKHTKILRDNINGITQPGIQRLARRGGVKRLSGLVYEVVRSLIRMAAETIINRCAHIVEYQRTRTITPEVLRAGASTVGYNLLVYNISQ